MREEGPGKQCGEGSGQARGGHRTGAAGSEQRPSGLGHAGASVNSRPGAWSGSCGELKAIRAEGRCPPEDGHRGAGTCAGSIWVRRVLPALGVAEVPGVPRGVQAGRSAGRPLGFRVTAVHTQGPGHLGRPLPVPPPQEAQPDPNVPRGSHRSTGLGGPQCLLKGTLMSERTDGPSQPHSPGVGP